MATVVDIISRLPALQDIDPQKAKLIAELFSEKRYSAGERIFQENTVRERLVIIEEGMVEVTRHSGVDHAVPLIAYGPGDVIGEGILLGDAEHIDTSSPAHKI